MRTECVSLFYILLRSSSCSFTCLNLVKPYLLGILDTRGPLGGTQGGTQAIYWYRELTLCIFKLQHTPLIHNWIKNIFENGSCPDGRAKLCANMLIWSQIITSKNLKGRSNSIPQSMQPMYAPP